MKRFLLLLALPELTACGFRPVYSAAPAASQAPVSVAEIEGRTGYELRKRLETELIAGLPGVSEPAWLEVELDERLRRLAFKPDEAASSSDLRARARYVFTSGERIVTGSVEGETSFSVPEAPYGDIAAQTAARERVAHYVAGLILDDLRLKLATGRTE